MTIFRPKDRIVCFCRQITEGMILKAVREGAGTLQEIREATGAGTGNDCVRLHPQGRCCAADIQSLLKKAVSRQGFEGGG